MRLVHLEGQWSCPTGGAGSVRIRLGDDPATTREGVAGFERPLALAGR